MIAIGWQFPTKNYSVEVGIDGTIGLFQRNSGCSMEQKTLGIPFRTIPGREKCSEFFIIKHRSKLSEFCLNHSAKENTIGNSVPWNKNRSKLSEFCHKTFRKKNKLLILFAGTGKLRFESFSQNEPSKNFQNSVKKDYF